MSWYDFEMAWHMTDPSRFDGRLFKTALCQRFLTKKPGDCLRGDLCPYAHAPEELLRPPEQFTKKVKAYKKARLAAGLPIAAASSSQEEEAYYPTKWQVDWDQFLGDHGLQEELALWNWPEDLLEAAYPSAGWEAQAAKGEEQPKEEEEVDLDVLLAELQQCPQPEGAEAEEQTKRRHTGPPPKPKPCPPMMPPPATPAMPPPSKSISKVGHTLLMAKQAALAKAVNTPAVTKTTTPAKQVMFKATVPAPFIRQSFQIFDRIWVGRLEWPQKAKGHWVAFYVFFSMMSFDCICQCLHVTLCLLAAHACRCNAAIKLSLWAAMHECADMPLSTSAHCHAMAMCHSMRCVTHMAAHRPSVGQACSVIILMWRCVMQACIHVCFDGVCGH